MQSRHYFTQLERLANFPAFGFLTGRGCSDLTYAVQVPIEEALGQRRDLCGGLTLKSVLTYTQESGDVLGPLVWRTPFLRQMHRAFRVRHEPSDAVHSSCGLPGGDGHSCVGMILLDFSFHLYMQHFQPGINELSFVDSLQLISTCPGGLTAGVGTLETWADLFRLRIDSRKTQYWALKSQHRQLLLSFGLPVVECTSDLGATMQYSAKHLNRPFQQRILQPLLFWTKLRKLSLSPWFKLLAIKVALLPRALHASCSVFLGDSWFVKLRTQVMRATRVSRAGANPILRAAFMFGADADPGFHDAWNSFGMFLHYYQTNFEIREIWTRFVQTPGARRAHGTFAKLLKLYRNLSWSLPTAHTLQMGPNFHVDLSWIDLKVAKQLLTYY